MDFVLLFKTGISQAVKFLKEAILFRLLYKEQKAKTEKAETELSELKFKAERKDRVNKTLLEVRDYIRKEKRIMVQNQVMQRQIKYNEIRDKFLDIKNGITNDMLRECFIILAEEGEIKSGGVFGGHIIKQ